MISVQRNVHIAWPHPNGEAVAGPTAYVSRHADRLLQYAGFGDDSFLQRSEDNGATWKRAEDWTVSHSLSDGLTRMTRLTGIYMDPHTGRAMRMILENQSRRTGDGSVSWFPASATYRNLLQYSHDEGNTWSEPEQLVVSGDGFDETHWAPEIQYGRNGGVLMGDSAFTRPDGTVVVPFTMVRAPDTGERRYRGKFLRLVAHDEQHGAWERQDAVMLGRWRQDGSGLDWRISNYVRVPQSHSVDGACEPGVCQLPDGRMFMIIRTRTFPDSQVQVPGCKHHAVSEDGGETWTAGRMLQYEDRGAVYAPASFSRVFVHCRRLYLMTNISDKPCYGCDPRTKLQIGEINTDTLRVIRDTVTVIDQWRQGQQTTIRFSNFAWHRERHSGKMILYMTPAPGPTGTWEAGDIRDTARTESTGVAAHSYRYEISLPD